MNWLAAALAGVVFLAILKFTDIMGAAARTLASAKAGTEALRNPALDDDAKEAAAQKTAMALFGGGLGLALRGALALAVPTLLVWGADRLGLIDAQAVFDILMLWPVWLTSFAIVAVVLVLRRRKR